MVLTCTGIGTSQTWNVMKEDVRLTGKVFTSGEVVGTQATRDGFKFTLISTQYNDFESTLSTVVTNALNNTTVVCTDHATPATVTIRIEGKYKYLSD